MDRNLVVLAGGISSRMRRAATAPVEMDPLLRREAMEKSKSMIGVGSGHRPFLDYVLYNAREAGFRDVVIVVGEADHSIREYYGAAERGNAVYGLRISYAVQTIPTGRTKPLGTADALLQALRANPPWAGRRFTVCNSDNLYSVRAFKHMLECQAPGGLIDYDRASLEFDQQRIEQFAVIETSDEGHLLRIIEKPSPDDISRIRTSSGRVGVSMNIFSLSYDMVIPFLDAIPLHPLRHEKELPIAVQAMIADHPGSMVAYPLAEHVPDLTHQADIPLVREYLRKNFPKFPLEHPPRPF